MNFLITLSSVFLLLLSLSDCFADEVTDRPLENLAIKIEAGKGDRHESWVKVKIPAALAKKKITSLATESVEFNIPCQVIQQEQDSLVLFKLESPLSQGTSRIYRFSSKSAPKEHQVELSIDQQLEVIYNEQSVLTYNTQFIPSPDPSIPFYGRSGFIHPVSDPLGRVVSEGFPEDHMHQHGIMFAWTKSEFEQDKIDFWNSHRLQGKIEHRELLNSFEGALAAGFQAKLAHVNLLGKNPKTVLDEIWEVQVIPTKDYYLIDFVSTQSCSTKTPLVIKQYHYGAMCFRGLSDWLDLEKSNFFTSEGKDRIAGNHTRPDWAQLRGTIEEVESQITLIPHPDNFRHPQAVRLHPKKPYFCFTPQYFGDFTIKPSQTYRSKFRFVITAGPFKPQLTEQLFQDYVDPIKGKLINLN